MWLTILCNGELLWAAGFCYMKDKELYVSVAVDVCIAVLPAVAPAVILNHRI